MGISIITSPMVMTSQFIFSVVVGCVVGGINKTQKHILNCDVLQNPRKHLPNDNDLIAQGPKLPRELKKLMYQIIAPETLDCVLKAWGNTKVDMSTINCVPL